uniref:Cornifelin n=1 Tax=Anolis carolinensis TaxID=28377 RepID=H9GDA7_ANOCA
MAFQPCPVVTQPVAVNRCRISPYRDWKSGLLDCSADQTICACGLLVPCVLACKVAVEYGECFCVPFLPGALVAMRTGLREQLRITVDSLRGIPGLGGDPKGHLVQPHSAQQL